MDPRYPAFSTTTTRRRSDILQMSATSSASLGSSSGGEGIGFGSSGLRLQGLSKYHQSILSRMAHERQRFVSGKFPVVVEATETPTLRWLGRGKTSAAASQVLLVNGTSVERSLASYDRFQWLDDEERAELHDKYALVSWELLAVISLPKPGYVTVLPGYGAGSTAASARFLESTSRWDRWKRGGQVLLDELEERVCRPDRLWVTGFSLTGRSGTLHSIDTNTGHMESCNTRTSKSLKWPNEVNSVPSQYVDSPADGNKLENTKSETTTTTTSGTTTTTPQLADLKDAILVSDGFLIPGKDQGGIHVVKQPGNPNSEWAVCLTEITGYDRWFYHRAIWTDLTGDGRKSILTARAKSPFGSSNGNIHGNSNGSGSGSGKKTKPPVGQLVCLEMPQPYRIDEKTGTPLERDGTVFDPLSSQHLPWKQQ